MTREEAFEQLKSEHSERRLDAARALVRLALPEDESAIRIHLGGEQNAWVRRALETALSTATAVLHEPVDIEVFEPDPIAKKMYLEAVRQMSDRVVHELRSILGVAEYWARNEVLDFDESATRSHFQRMRACLSAIDELSRASVMARADELILQTLIFEEVESCKQERGGGEVQLSGDESLLVRGDPSLLRLIVRNGVANALDVSTARNLPVTVTWGSSDRDYWIAVLDRAGMLPESVTQLFDFGTTTKAGHIGAGLALIQQAALALGGRPELSASADGTTTLRVQWPRPRSAVT